MIFRKQEKGRSLSSSVDSTESKRSKIQGHYGNPGVFQVSFLFSVAFCGVSYSLTKARGFVCVPVSSLVALREQRALSRNCTLTTRQVMSLLELEHVPYSRHQSDVYEHASVGVCVRGVGVGFMHNTETE